MNFDFLKKQISIETLSNRENDLKNDKTNKTSYDISEMSSNSFDLPIYKNRMNYNKEDIIQFTIENDNQNKEILLLKSKLKKFLFEANLVKEKYKKEITRLFDENKILESNYQKIKNEKEKYINNIKLLQINNNKLQNDINILKSQIETSMNNETKYVDQISNLIQEMNIIKEKQNEMISNNNMVLQNYKNEIKDLNEKLKEKTILENELNNLINDDKINMKKNINQSLSDSINFINGKMKKYLTDSEQFQKGKIMKENKLYIDIRDLIEEFNEIKKLVNNKDIQIKNTNIDKYILIENNKKLNNENNLLKQHINKLIINIDLYIQKNHLAVQRIYELENYLNKNKA